MAWKKSTYNPPKTEEERRWREARRREAYRKPVLTKRENRMLMAMKAAKGPERPPRKLTPQQFAAMKHAPPAKGLKFLDNPEGGKVSHHHHHNGQCKHKTNALVFSGNIFSRYR
jgi:hypothetical protein